MGNFIGVYSDEPDQLNAVVASRNPAKLREADEALTRLINGEFDTSESPDAYRLLNAFETVCQACSQNQATVEIYLDEETVPALWKFAWEAAETRFGLPLSAYGTPAVGFWEHAQLPTWIATLQQLNQSAEIQELLATLKSAHARTRGVFVFVNE